METVGQQQQQQLLVRFEQSRTLVVNVPVNKATTSSDAHRDCILQATSDQLHYPTCRLELTHLDPPFCSVRLISAIRGGKGGFGTLLKGQSKQASANTTKNFGACRDLQGRRLKHVNDALNYELWKEWNEKVQAGTATLDEMAEALVNPESGVAGWHLQLPAWSEVSKKKELRKMKSLLQQYKQRRETAQERKQEQKNLRDAKVSNYVQDAETQISQQQDMVQDALQKLQQRQQADTVSSPASKRVKSDVDNRPPPAILTLSGDAVLGRDEATQRWKIQGDSNFCTVGIMLDKQGRESGSRAFYWELLLVSGGLAQIGWATRSFRPNSESGDGAGDSQHSWAFDGSRSIKLHNEKEEPYGQAWKKQDVLGCLWSDGRISFLLNGQELGVAYTVDDPSLFPVISCNQGETLELRLFDNEFDFLPNQAAAVGSVLQQGELSLESLLDELGEDEDDAPEQETAQKTPEQEAPAKKDPVVAEKLDLTDYASIDVLKELGADRLKSALMAEGLKCGGTLEQRAERLFAIRGLQSSDYPKKLLAKKKA